MATFESGFLEKQKGRIERRIQKYKDPVRIKDELLSGKTSPYTDYKQEKLVPILEKTLQKIRNGDYGICENCGQIIEEQRLKLVPAAELCMNCIPKKKKG
jgi:RNA polymerase-binding transcription factor DksA